MGPKFVGSCVLLDVSTGTIFAKVDDDDYYCYSMMLLNVFYSSVIDSMGWPHWKTTVAFAGPILASHVSLGEGVSGMLSLELGFGVQSRHMLYATFECLIF